MLHHARQRAASDPRVSHTHPIRGLAGPGYNGPVSRGTGQLAFILLLSGFVTLAVGPFQLGTVRLAGVSVLWWYGVVLAPMLGVVVTLLFVVCRAERAAAAESEPLAAAGRARRPLARAGRRAETPPAPEERQSQPST